MRSRGWRRASESKERAETPARFDCNLYCRHR
jgi:hypothetical protein